MFAGGRCGGYGGGGGENKLAKMKRIIDFGDKNYIDCKTDIMGLFLRIYPSNFDDGTFMLDTQSNMPDNITPIEYFRINDKIGATFFMINQNK